MSRGRARLLVWAALTVVLVAAALLPARWSIPVVLGGLGLLLVGFGRHG